MLVVVNRIRCPTGADCLGNLLVAVAVPADQLQAVVTAFLSWYLNFVRSLRREFTIPISISII